MSRCIMLIRHAEKPGEGEGGVDAAGRADDDGLSVAGWRRAGALVPYFSVMAAAVAGLGRPQHVFAAATTARHRSTRPRDTVQALAQALGVSADERWSDDDAPEGVAEGLRGFDAPVLVCWRHDALPALARALVRSDGVPARWPDDRFDLIWSVRPGREGWEFQQLPQRLLAGDRADVVDR